MARDKQTGKTAAKRPPGRKALGAGKVARADNGAKAAKGSKSKSNSGKAAARGKSKSNGAAAARAKRRANGGAASLDERQDKISQAELLLSVSNKLAAHQTLDEQLQTLVDMTNSVIGVERGTLFLNDNQTGELYSRVAQGDVSREIRIMNTTGIAGHVYTSGEGMIIQDAYKNELFNRAIDEQTGFKTRSILCAPVRTVNGDSIGVAQMLNKKKGRFNEADLDLLQAMTTQAAVALQSTLFVEEMEASREKELEFLGIVSELSSELQLGPLLQKIMATVTRLLDSERSTLFLNDEKTNELYTEVGEGLGATKIRFPNAVGIAGAVFSSGKSVNIPYAYADLRFNPSFDKQTGFFTRSILCVPVINKNSKIIGVTQVLNKRGATFDEDDESRLNAFTAQIAIGLENAQLFDDVQNIKNYNESMLESMSNAVVTLDEDGKIVTCNASGLRIMRVAQDDIIGKQAEEFFADKNAWIVEKIARVTETGESDIVMDSEMVFDGEEMSINVTVLPLQDAKKNMLGAMIMMEDISSEKRVKSTMARYMDPSLADQLVEGGEEMLGGQGKDATVLFSDIRGFTTLTEELGAQGTVQLLNEYFTVMVDCIQAESGVLDKFIGDAIMAIFGTPFAHEDDEDRGVRCACAMMAELNVFNAERIAKDKLPVDMGVGVNTGYVVSGNIGSPKRMDYTVIGDGVNLSARLESACKQYSAHILISEFTMAKLRGTYRSREIDKVVVKGKTEPVGVVEILDYHTDETFPNMMEALNQFRGGIDLYRTAKWDAAIKAFKDVLALNPADKLSETYIDRCAHMKKHPPKGEWDGVWVMTSK
ncbi:MAG: GAF domain-containing protein [Alphaproteobacteria bacterium]|nr:GAF domain-containing protein [Alphaproteobacteria bacterium]